MLASLIPSSNFSLHRVQLDHLLAITFEFASRLLPKGDRAEVEAAHYYVVSIESSVRCAKTCGGLLETTKK